MPVPNSQIREEVLRQVAARGADKSICPSEVARALDPDWQSLMSRIRKIAIALVVENHIEILRKGKPVEPKDVKGVIRLRLKSPERQLRQDLEDDKQDRDDDKQDRDDDKQDRDDDKKDPA